MLMEKCSIHDAAIWLAKFSGENPHPPERPEPKRRPRPPKPLELSPHPYLDSRVSRETARHFGLGYATSGYFKGRVCVPIHDESGRLVAYAGRYPSEEVPENQLRYTLPRGFRKSEVIYNLNRVMERPAVVIVEGFFSVYRLYELDIPAVSLMGSHLSETQARLLRIFDAVTLLLDGDEAGRAAADKAALILVKQQLTRVVQLPEGTQPDTCPAHIIRSLLGL